MFESWVTKLEGVHEAKTREERDAVYAFRYKVYVEELGRELGGADHVRKIVCDEDDEQDSSTQLYTGPLEDISGTVRLRIWQPGQIPKHEFEMLSMSSFPDIESRAISELGRLMIRPTLRGKLLLPSLVRSVYERMRSERKQVADSLRAQGNEAAARIRAEADRKAQVVRADAYRDAQKLRGEGDATAADVYAKAYSKDPEFYAFYRSLEAYRQSLGKSGNGVLVLDPTSEFLHYLRNSK